jgi:hypothetical protein
VFKKGDVEETETQEKLLVRNGLYSELIKPRPIGLNN